MLSFYSRIIQTKFAEWAWTISFITFILNLFHFNLKTPDSTRLSCILIIIYFTSKNNSLTYFLKARMSHRNRWSTIKVQKQKPTTDYKNNILTCRLYALSGCKYLQVEIDVRKNLATFMVQRRHAKIGSNLFIKNWNTKLKIKLCKGFAKYSKLAHAGDINERWQGSWIR